MFCTKPMTGTYLNLGINVKICEVKHNAVWTAFKDLPRYLRLPIRGGLLLLFIGRNYSCYYVKNLFTISQIYCFICKYYTYKPRLIFDHVISLFFENIFSIYIPFKSGSVLVTWRSTNKHVYIVIWELFFCTFTTIEQWTSNSVD